MTARPLVGGNSVRSLADSRLVSRYSCMMESSTQRSDCCMLEPPHGMSTAKDVGVGVPSKTQRTPRIDLQG